MLWEDGLALGSNIQESGQGICIEVVRVDLLIHTLGDFRVSMRIVHLHEENDSHKSPDILSFVLPI